MPVVVVVVVLPSRHVNCTMDGTRTQIIVVRLQHLQVVIMPLGLASCLQGEVKKT